MDTDYGCEHGEHRGGSQMPGASESQGGHQRAAEGSRARARHPTTQETRAYSPLSVTPRQRQWWGGWRETDGALV
jgi:hypothetical protein